MRHILNIEYEYVRVYINSLALQAVVERCANATPGAVPPAATTAVTSFNGATSHRPDHARDATASLPPPHTHMHPRGGGYGASVPFSALASLYGNDQGFVRELVDACRNLLQTVVEGLLPGGYLQHAPVRTYFRIVSGAMFLLKVGVGPLLLPLSPIFCLSAPLPYVQQNKIPKWKDTYVVLAFSFPFCSFQTFALGAKEADVAISLGLLDSAVEALRTCVVDDVHLGIRFADLLDVLTRRIRSRFVRMATAAVSTGSSGGGGPGSGAAGGGSGGGGGGSSHHYYRRPNHPRSHLQHRESAGCPAPAAPPAQPSSSSPSYSFEGRPAVGTHFRTNTQGIVPPPPPPPPPPPSSLLSTAVAAVPPAAPPPSSSSSAWMPPFSASSSTLPPSLSSPAAAASGLHSSSAGTFNSGGGAGGIYAAGAFDNNYQSSGNTNGGGAGCSCGHWSSTTLAGVAGAAAPTAAVAAAAATAATAGATPSFGASPYAHNPLFGISTELIDPDDGQFSIMPPPSFAAYLAAASSSSAAAAAAASSPGVAPTAAAEAAAAPPPPPPPPPADFDVHRADADSIMFPQNNQPSSPPAHLPRQHPHRSHHQQMHHLHHHHHHHQQHSGDGGADGPTTNHGPHTGRAAAAAAAAAAADNDPYDYGGRNSNALVPPSSSSSSTSSASFASSASSAMATAATTAAMAAAAAAAAGAAEADWLALPLDPLLNSHGAGVTQTSLMGPDVGGFDLLEVLLDEMDGFQYHPDPDPHHPQHHHHHCPHTTLLPPAAPAATTTATKTITTSATTTSALPAAAGPGATPSPALPPPSLQAPAPPSPAPSSSPSRPSPLLSSQ